MKKLLLAMVIWLLLSGCAHMMTSEEIQIMKQKYTGLHPGMLPEDVIKLIGMPSEISSLPSRKTLWQYCANQWKCYLYLTFKDGKLVNINTSWIGRDDPK